MFAKLFDKLLVCTGSQTFFCPWKNMTGSLSPAEYEIIKRMCANMNKEDLGFGISCCDCRILKIVI